MNSESSIGTWFTAATKAYMVVRSRDNMKTSFGVALFGTVVLAVSLLASAMATWVVLGSYGTSLSNTAISLTMTVVMGVVTFVATRVLDAALSIASGEMMMGVFDWVVASLAILASGLVIYPATAMIAVDVFHIRAIPGQLLIMLLVTFLVVLTADFAINLWDFRPKRLTAEKGAVT